VASSRSVPLRPISVGYRIAVVSLSAAMAAKQRKLGPRPADLTVLTKKKRQRFPL
jgi:hypothetical protein